MLLEVAVFVDPSDHVVDLDNPDLQDLLFQGQQDLGDHLDHLDLMASLDFTVRQVTWVQQVI